MGDPSDVSEAEYEYQYGLCNYIDDDEYEYDRALRGLDAHCEQPIVMRGQWRVQSGAVLEIVNMTDDHLKNAIALWERNGIGDHPKTEELRAELRRRDK